MAKIKYNSQFIREKNVKTVDLSDITQPLSDVEGQI